MSFSELATRRAYLETWGSVLCRFGPIDVQSTLSEFGYSAVIPTPSSNATGFRPAGIVWLKTSLGKELACMHKIHVGSIAK